jgi:sugar phosphate isomerase/epimerase
VEARYRGGAKQRFERNDPMRDPLFFELGSHGGVDFPGLIAYLNEIEWKGWLTVELDSSPYRPPKDSAILSRRYLENTLHIPVS